jgi:hypothetical protein
LLGFACGKAIVNVGSEKREDVVDRMSAKVDSYRSAYV